MASAHAPYGELVDTTMRAMTWNGWGRFGPWQRRAAGIVNVIGEVMPDVVLLQESWVDAAGVQQWMLTGEREPARPGFVLFDAWDAADRGATWSRTNPWTVPTLLPDRRIDNLLTGWPHRGGVGSTVASGVAGTQPVDGAVPSDHYAVWADVRY